MQENKLAVAALLREVSARALGGGRVLGGAARPARRVRGGRARARSLARG